MAHGDGACTLAHVDRIRELAKGEMEMMVAIRTFGWTALAGLAFICCVTQSWASDGGSAVRTWRVALVQFDAVPEQPERNLTEMERLARLAVSQGARLVMFHEGALTDYTPRLNELGEQVPDGPAYGIPGPAALLFPQFRAVRAG